MAISNKNWHISIEIGLTYWFSVIREKQKFDSPSFQHCRRRASQLTLLYIYTQCTCLPCMNALRRFTSIVYCQMITNLSAIKQQLNLEQTSQVVCWWKTYTIYWLDLLYNTPCVELITRACDIGIHNIRRQAQAIYETRVDSFHFIFSFDKAINQTIHQGQFRVRAIDNVISAYRGV